MPRDFDARSALAFIIAFGAVSFFADMAYEGMRAISGPFLGSLGANGLSVGLIAGGGELFGYLLRLGSGRLAARTRRYWAITLLGYVIQMSAVPLMALAGNIWSAAAFIMMERAGKAVRSPAASTLKSRAGHHIGQGWAFGLHEAMDQTGAMAGPLIAAFVLASHHAYRLAFAWLAIPALSALLAVLILRLRYGFAGQVARAPVAADSTALPRAFWLYAGTAACIAAGFCDYPLIAYHDMQAHLMRAHWVPILYAAAMAAAGVGSLAFGQGYDRRGLRVLLPGTLLGAAVAPLVFLGGFAAAVIGTILWGLALGVHEAVMNAGLADLVAEHARARAYGIFTALYGVAWFAGSALSGELYDLSPWGLVAVSVVLQLAALLPLQSLLRTLAKPEH